MSVILPFINLEDLDKDLDKLVNFALENLNYENMNRDIVKDIILKHMNYGTFDYCLDKKGEVMFCIRWNIKDDIAEILDFIINRKYRNSIMFDWIISRNILNFPYVNYLSFTRHKYRDKKRIYDIQKLLKIKKEIIKKEVMNVA